MRNFKWRLFLRKRNCGNSSHSILCETEELQLLNDHLFGKELFILFAASAFRKLSSIYVFSYFPFGFEGRIWDLIVSVPDHCLSFYFSSHRLSVCESRTAELRDIVYSLCGSETAELQVTGYSLCGGGTARLKVKALVWKRNCETSSRTKFIVWKRNCVTSKPQYFPCAEAELRHFRVPSHTLFCMRKRNCGTLSLSIFLMRRRNFKPKNSPCVEAELQNFKSHNSLVAEAELQVT